MFQVRTKSFAGRNLAAVLLGLLFAVTILPNVAYAGKKKAAPAPTTPQSRPARPEDFDVSKIVFPNPPAIARIRYMRYITGEKIEKDVSKQKPKSGWMDRLAGTQPAQERKNAKIPYQLIAPNGMAVDSRGRLYAADYRVGAVFIFNLETGESELIKNGAEANFKIINAVAIDDADRIFVSDSGFHHVLVFNSQRKLEDELSGNGMITPNGLAIDNENRLLYVADTDLDQILVYDLDTLKLKRKMGTAGHHHELTDNGNFAWPTGLAVDGDGNLYVTDTLNDRVEIFDAEGNFISSFGSNCDSPGCFQRPKGIAIDSDGHIWVADTMMSRVQVFDREGQLLIFFGSYGKYPAQFNDLSGITIDKNNRVFVSEMQPGRIQVLRYVTDAEADSERQRRAEERKKRAGFDKPADTAPAQSPDDGSGKQESAASSVPKPPK